MLCTAELSPVRVHITIHIASDLPEDQISVSRRQILMTEGLTQIPINLILAMRELRNVENIVKLIDSTYYIATCAACTREINTLIFGVGNKENLFSGFMLVEPNSKKTIVDVMFLTSRFQSARRIKSARSGCHDREGKENRI